MDKLSYIRTKLEKVQPKVVGFLLPLVFIMLLISLVVVRVGNHALYNNTRFYEDTSALYVIPEFYSLSEMKVEVEKTYYAIKEVVYVFRSVGTQFSISQGVLTQGYSLGLYGAVLWVDVLSFVYFLVISIKGRLHGSTLRLFFRNSKPRAIFTAVTFVMFVFLTLQLLFPLL